MSDQSPRLMAHLIAGYPDLPNSALAAEGLIAGGADYLEIQFPFSDPTADGPVIEAACSLALKQGFKVEEGFRMIREIKSKYPGQSIFVMCYANTAFSIGVEDFVAEAANSGVDGLIVPDLPPDYDEGLYRFCKEQGLAAVPVAAPTLPKNRLEMISSLKPDFVYCAIRGGITGSDSEIGSEAAAFLQKVKNSCPQANILAGFGISRPQQVAAISPFCDTIVVGSHFVRQLNQTIKADAEIQPAMKQAALELKGSKG